MLLVEELLELEVIGLDLSLGDSAEESVALGELQRVAEHVKLGKGGLLGLRTPVLMDIIDCFAPILDLLRRPLLLVEEMIMQLLQPAGEDGVSGLLLGSEAVHLLSCCADTRTALLLDPLANLGTIELEQITLAAAAC